MSLSSNVQARYSDQKLVELTNPGAPGATSIDTDRLNAAIADVEAEFEVVAGLEYDDDDAKHVSAAVEGVMVVLRVRQRGNLLAVSDEWEKWRESLERLAQVTSRDRIIPQSSSQVVPSRFDQDVQPAFDNQRFDALAPRRRRAD